MRHVHDLKLTPFFRLLQVRHALDRPGTPTITRQPRAYPKLERQ